MGDEVKVLLTLGSEGLRSAGVGLEGDLSSIIGAVGSFERESAFTGSISFVADAVVIAIVHHGAHALNRSASSIDDVDFIT